MAKEVTLEDLSAWLKKNARRTWKLFDGWEEGGTHEIKYITPHVDTRTMTIWRLEWLGLGNGGDVSVHDEFEGTLLELMESRLDEPAMAGKQIKKIGKNR